MEKCVREKRATLEGTRVSVFVFSLVSVVCFLNILTFEQ